MKEMLRRIERNSSQETSQASREESEIPAFSIERHFSWTVLIFAGSKDWGISFVISKSLLATRFPSFNLYQFMTILTKTDDIIKKKR